MIILGRLMEPFRLRTNKYIYLLTPAFFGELG